MRLFKVALVAVVCMVVVTTDLLAQYTTPISFWLSPQLTAPTAMSGNDYQQISAHYQKLALVGNIGARSMVLSGQFPLYSRNNVPFGTAGINILRQDNGTAYLFSTTGAVLSYNYTVRFSSQHHLVGGVQGGFFSRKIDWNKATTRNQFADGQINPNLDHGETFHDYRSQAFTTNIGLAYYLTDARGEQRFHIGAGMINANKGRFTYLENDNSQAEPVKWMVYSQLRLISNPFFELATNMYWQQENKFNDFVGGLQLNKGINPRKTVSEEHLGLGVYYSPDHSATLAMQLLRQNMLLGLSYSMPFGDKDLYGIQSAAEVTLGWRLQRSGKKAAYYAGGNRNRLPAYGGAKRSSSKKLENRTLNTKYKVKSKAARAFKSNASKKADARSRKFNRKVASYKSRAKKESPAYKNKSGLKSLFSKKNKFKYRKVKRPSYKKNRPNKWKLKRRGLLRMNNRRN
ncbi:type IX secretion system membrane protein PorP/SprF [Cesiribacter sp. SM1]|uniref:type IX secretion system membrane protein PorP/SprF n=1 Tax=Cesiribacter sp. SM1 TaxID=2861196 RepID=UPI001CD590CB|nr:type IX secretion system membrane protein PorP/SprF [Cesiribacter sp. SM1]